MLSEVNFLGNNSRFLLIVFFVFGVLGALGASVKALTLSELSASQSSSDKYPIDAKLDGPITIYTDYLIDAAQTWPNRRAEFVAPKDGNPVGLHCIETPGHPDVIGVRQTMVVNAPLSQVEAVLDDINHYQDLFPGYADIHIVSQEENKLVSYWEQHIPLFFVPNVKYEMNYLLNKGSKARKIYRYQLKQSKSLKSSDGLIVIESDSSNSSQERTYFYEYDFFDADWGVLKTIAPSRIWNDSIEGIYLSDVAIKLKAENPKWTYEKIVEEGKKFLEQYPVKQVIEQKSQFKKNRRPI